MRRWTSAVKLSLIGVAALTLISCGASTHPGQPEVSRTFDGDQVESSGERLSGDFDLSSLEDSYRASNAHPQPKTVFSFDENGNLKRQEKQRIDEGTYWIGKGGELVIYIEKVNGEPLAAARAEHYTISERSADSIALQSGPSGKLILRRR